MYMTIMQSKWENVKKIKYGGECEKFYSLTELICISNENEFNTKFCSEVLKLTFFVIIW